MGLLTVCDPDGGMSQCLGRYPGVSHDYHMATSFILRRILVGNVNKSDSGPCCVCVRVCVCVCVDLPLHSRDGLGWAVEVLFELQLEGLSDGADHILGQAVTTLQDMTR